MQKRQSRKQGEQGKKFTILIPYLIALSSGVLMGLTVAPFGAWFLGWIALAPLWVLVIRSSQRKNSTPPTPHLLIPVSLVWGIGYHGLALSWITGIHPMTWMGVPWLASLAIALFCWIFITLWGAALVASWAICFSWILSFKVWIHRKFQSFSSTPPSSPPPLLLSSASSLAPLYGAA